MSWDGTSLTRPDSSVYRAPDGADWAQIVHEIQQSGFELVANDSIFIGNIIDSEIKLANSSNNNILGIAISDGIPGTLIRIKVLGVVNRSDWTPIAGSVTLVMGADYFLVSGGKISISPPNTGWSHKIGSAVTPSEFLFQKQTSVRL
jgi:hypothetical protein